MWCPVVFNRVKRSQPGPATNKHVAPCTHLGSAKLYVWSGGITFSPIMHSTRVVVVSMPVAATIPLRPTGDEAV